MRVTERGLLVLGAVLNLWWVSPTHGALMVSSDTRNASVNGSAGNFQSPSNTQTYSFSDSTSALFGEFHPNLSGSATALSGPTGSAQSAAKQDSSVTLAGATYRSDLSINADPFPNQGQATSTAAAASAFHLTFSVPNSSSYSLAFDLNFSGTGSYPFSIPITWNYSFSSENQGVIGSRSISYGHNSAGPAGDPGYVQYAYTGVLDPADTYTIDFTQQMDATAISDQTFAHMTSNLTLTTVPEADSGAFWGVILLAVCAAMRRRTRVAA
jgi:hypothetical protein